MPQSEETQERKRRAYLDELDQPAHALTAGGINGAAGINGVPGRPDGSPHGLQLMAKGVVYAEPVAVVLRDAVTIETAERLLGADRRMLNRSVRSGYLPAIKLGPGTVPYLVRLRDVAWWMAQRASSSRSRRQKMLDSNKGDENTGYIGFQPWLVEQVRHHNPGVVLEAAGSVTPYAAKTRRFVNRGGRPPKLAPGPEIPADEKTVSDAPNHAPETAKPQPVKIAADPIGLTPEQRRRLPKWHPLWLRPDSAGPAPIRPRR